MENGYCPNVEELERIKQLLHKLIPMYYHLHATVSVKGGAKSKQDVDILELLSEVKHYDNEYGVTLLTRHEDLSVLEFLRDSS